MLCFIAGKSDKLKSFICIIKKEPGVYYTVKTPSSFTAARIMLLHNKLKQIKIRQNSSENKSYVTF